MAQCSSGDQTVNTGLLASSVRLLLEKGIANCIIRFEDSATYGGPREIEVVANTVIFCAGSGNGSASHVGVVSSADGLQFVLVQISHVDLL